MSAPSPPLPGTGAPVKALARGSACSVCRRRKLRCDGVRPSCSTCTRLKHACAYGDSGTEKLNEQIGDLEEQVRTLERELQQVRSGQHSARPPPSIPAHYGPSLGAINRDDSLGKSPEFAFSLLDGPSATSPRNGGRANGGFPSYTIPHAAPPTFSASPPVFYDSASAPYGAGASGYPSRPRSPVTQVQRPHSSLQQLQHHLQHRVFHEGDSFTARVDGDGDADNRTTVDQSSPVSEDWDYSGERDAKRHQHHSPASGSDRSKSRSHSGTTATSTSTVHHYIPSASPHLQSFPFSTSNATGLADLMNPSVPLSVVYTSPGGMSSRGDGRPINPIPNRYEPGHASFLPRQLVDVLPPSPPASGTGWVSGDGFGNATLPAERGIAGTDGWGLGNELVGSGWNGELPELELIQDLTSLYFHTLHQHFPFLSRTRFLYSLHHPTSLSSAPSLSLIFALLAVSAPYHEDPLVRARGAGWYKSAKEAVEQGVENGVRASARGVGGPGGVSLTVEMVQALALLTIVEMGRGDHQRAFMTISSAARIAAMLGIHRMDEDRIAKLDMVPTGKRLRPPALHPLPEDDALLMEECRRTMCTVLIIDRFEAACVGWPTSIAEADLRLLLPCHEDLYAAGTCTAADNPLWWPIDLGIVGGDLESGIRVGTFAWLCRVTWLGGRIQAETYRPAGVPAPGPFFANTDTSPLENEASVMEMDLCLDMARTRLNQLAASQDGKGPHGPTAMILIVLNCLVVNLHHLRVAQGLTSIPFDSNQPIIIGSAEFSMQRCLEGLKSVFEIVAQLAQHDNLHTSLHSSRITSFTSLPPYLLFCLAFPAKFTIGRWEVLGTCWARVATDTEEGEGMISGKEKEGGIPSGDDVFGPGLDEDRMRLIEMYLNGMERISVVWDVVGDKFTKMIKKDAARIFSGRQSLRQSPSAASSSSHASSLPSAPS